MNKEEFKKLIKQAKTRDEKQELLNKLMQKYPDITIQEAMVLGFSYLEIIFG